MKECMYQQNTSPKGCYYENKDHSVIFIECDTADCYYKQLQRVKQENARLKKIIYGDNTIRPTVCVVDEDYEKAIIGNAIYRKAFEEIRRIAKIENIPDIISPNDLATFYIERTQQLKEIQNKVNEVLQ